MLGAYFTDLEKSLRALEESDGNKQIELKEMRKELNILRRDLNDVHSIIMLRDIASKIKKQDRIVFVGTGHINENSLHAFVCCKILQSRQKINTDVEIIYVARTKIEYAFISKFNFEGTYLWQYQYELVNKIISAKTVVLSSHLFSNWGDCLLSACIGSSKTIQLWHGLPAKSIGLSVMEDYSGNFHQVPRMLNDCLNVNYVLTENNLPSVFSIYQQAFPNAELIATGSIRLHSLFSSAYRSMLLDKKENRSIVEWINKTDSKMKVLYCPTYREDDITTKTLFEHLKKILNKQYENFSVAIKLHISTTFNNDQVDELIGLASNNGHLYIEKSDEPYSSFPDFDAIITDYSSIRMDFAVLGKPVFLYQFDKESYNRTTDVVELFRELDAVSYYLNNFDELGELLQKDELKVEREEFVNNRLKNLLYDDSANKVVNTILEIHNQY